MAKHSSVPITLPARIKPGDDISAGWANSIREALWRLTMRGTPDVPRQQNRGSGPNPFEVRLIVIPAEGEGDPTYEVEVMDGCINERIPGVQDPPVNATDVHKPWNILWGDDAPEGKLATNQRTFPISIGDQVSILVNVAAEGNIELPAGAPGTTLGPTEIAVEDEDTESIHYVPPRPVDDDEGAAGVYHYKLAVLRDKDATHSGPWLELFLAGSHLSHFAELPILDNMSGEAENKGRVFKEYDPETNTYTFRVLDATVGELTITENEDGVEIRGNEKDGTLTVTIEGESPITALTWVDGLVDQAGNTNITIPDFTPEGFSGDALLRDCDGDPGADPPTDGTIIFRLAIENGIILGVNEPVGTGEGQRPLSGNVQTKYVQSCCWIDDQDHSHSV
jgi:hypothetical protein